MQHVLQPLLPQCSPGAVSSLVQRLLRQQARDADAGAAVDALIKLVGADSVAQVAMDGAQGVAGRSQFALMSHLLQHYVATNTAPAKLPELAKQG